jgi:hypothetical protein
LAQCPQAQGIVALRESHPTLIGHQRAVEELRRSAAQRFVEQKLAGRARQQIRSPHHFRDPHRGIIHDDGQLIRGQAIVPPHDKIAEVPTRHEALGAKLAVRELD